MAHSLYSTHHINTRWVAFAIAVALAMASVVWIAAFVVGDRLAFDVDRPQIAPPSHSVPAPAFGNPWPAWMQSPRPFGITELPGGVGVK